MAMFLLLDQFGRSSTTLLKSSRLHASVQVRQVFDKWFRQINEGHTNEDIVLLDDNIPHCMFLVRI